MRYSFRVRAEDHERFAPHAFDNAIGTTVPITLNGRPIGDATVVAADVADDGGSVELTYDMLGDLLAGWVRDEVTS
jgi:hypothetical protein